MLKKINRLKKRKEFNYIYKKGEVLHSADFSIHFTRAFKPYAQIGISVSKTVGNSVVRSRVKRIISEACRLNIEKFAIKNYVITAKPPIVNKKSTEIESELLSALKKKHLLIDARTTAQKQIETKPFEPTKELAKSAEKRVSAGKNAQTKTKKQPIKDNKTEQDKILAKPSKLTKSKGSKNV